MRLWQVSFLTSPSSAAANINFCVAEGMRFVCLHPLPVSHVHHRLIMEMASRGYRNGWTRTGQRKTCPPYEDLLSEEKQGNPIL